jgi:glycerol-3-phosphate acyltransferase PlsY
MMWLPTISVVLFGYLLGAISFAVLVAKRQGVDIFNVGSGNPGATNVKRVLGAKWGNLVFALDAAKGVLAAAFPLLMWAELHYAVLGLIAAIGGHSYSIFIAFRGGKGVATAMGGLLVIMPLVLLIGLALWLILFYATRIVALASLMFALSLPITAGLNYGVEHLCFGLSLGLALLILLRHRSNILRIMKGEENTFTK